jgi:hypothetical protein
VRNHAIVWIYAFMTFIVMGNFLSINFFISTVCEEFIRAKDHKDQNLM